MEIEYYTLLDILNKNKDRIEKGDWEEVYESIPHSLRGEFTDFLIENNIDVSTLFKDYIPEYAFIHSELLTSIHIAESITEIQHSAFSGCKSLTSISIPDNVTKIGHTTFCGCPSLESITLPDNITDIGDGEFYNCPSLKSITLPNSITKIWDSAFQGCISLKEIRYDGTREEWKRVKLGADWITNCPAKITFLK